MRFIIVFCLLLFAARVTAQEKTPVYVPPVEGNVVALSIGDQAPFNGILLDEVKALNAAKLRVAYDEVYDLYKLQQTSCSLTIASYRNELLKADKELSVYVDKESSWLYQHRFAIGFAGGVVLGLVSGFGVLQVVKKVTE